MGRRVESKAEILARVARERAEKKNRKPKPIAKVGERGETYAKWERRIRREAIGKECEFHGCRNRIATMGEAITIHLCRRTDAYDLSMDRRNVRVIEKAHLEEGYRQPEDFDESGAHVPNNRRIEIVGERYGSEAAIYMEAELRKRGKIK